MKIVVGLSGGVDSAVVAGLLKAQGHEVIGVTLKLWQSAPSEENRTCCSATDMFDACRVSSVLGIEYLVLSRQNLFKSHVVKDFVDSFRAGKTPSPCVRCNDVVKLRPLWDVAKHLGADAIATGHYVRMIDGKIHEGVDGRKDQSYYLWSTDPEILSHLLTPLGDYTKDQVRQMAVTMGLHVAAKKDSTDLCFLEGLSHGEFIDGLVEPPGEGDIVDESGNVLGRHEGYYRYTRGQKRGLNGKFVLRVIPSENKVVVGSREDTMGTNIVIDSTTVKFHGSTEGKSLTARVRSHGEKIHCEIKGDVITLKAPATLPASGQAVVVYEGDVVVAGGFVA